MRCLVLFVAMLTVSITVRAQKELEIPENGFFRENNVRQRYELFDISPQLKFPNSDGLVFADSIRDLSSPVPYTIKPRTQVYVQSPMPVASPGEAFSSNMPVMVPDSSVRYFILQKKIDIVNPLSRSRENER